MSGGCKIGRFYLSLQLEKKRDGKDFMEINLN